MKTVLVTGATGALGQAVIARLQGHGHYRVFATRRHGGTVSGFQLDVRDRNRFIAAIDSVEPDLVLHLAATFANDFDEAYSVNVAATRQNGMWFVVSDGWNGDGIPEGGPPGFPCAPPAPPGGADATGIL